jgi:hypothetical protein
MSEGPEGWAEVSDEEANHYRRDPTRQVAAPATALMVVGCLGIVANLLVAVGLNAIRPSPGPAGRLAGMDDETFKQYERGRAAAPLVDCCVVAVPTLAVYPLVIVAGIRMRQLRSRGLAMVGAIMGMAPCSPVLLLGLPVGVWSLVVLADPAVRAAFAGQRERP